MISVAWLGKIRSILKKRFRRRRLQIAMKIIIWQGAMADHALFLLQVNASAKLGRLKRSLSVLLEATCMLQDHWADESTCLVRRQKRLPTQVRWINRKFAKVTSESQRQDLQCAGWSLLQAHRAQQDAGNIRRSLANGCAIQPSKKLHKLSDLILPPHQGHGPPEVTADRSKWEAPIANHFGNKWGQADISRREEILNLCALSEGVALDFTPHEVCGALEYLRRKSRKDSDGVSVAALLVIAECRPMPVTRLINQVASDTRLCREQWVHGVVRGKVSAHSSLQQLRAILPVGVLWQTLDILISDRSIEQRN